MADQPNPNEPIERCAGCYARTAGQRARLEPTLEARVAAWCAALVSIGEGRWALCAEHAVNEAEAREAVHSLAVIGMAWSALHPAFTAIVPRSTDPHMARLVEAFDKLVREVGR